MWYFGGDSAVLNAGPFAGKGLQMRTGCAVSRDGLNWVRLDGPYRGACLDRGAEGDFDGFFAAWPKVVYDASGWKLYYHAMNRAAIFTVGVAISSDGLRWEKAGEVFGPGEPGSFDECGAGTRHVIRIGDDYAMFYEGVNSTRFTKGDSSIGVAL